MLKLLLITLSFFSQIALASSDLTCPPVNDKGVRLVDQKSQDTLEECIKQEPITKSLYFNNKTLRYSEARAALHQKIIDDIVNSKTCTVKKPAIAIFTAGLPGAGKSVFIKKHLKHFDNYVIVDADSIREKLPEYKGWNAFNTQSEANDIVIKILAKIGKPCNVDIIYDSSMTNPQRYIDLSKHLKELGYNVFIIYARIPTQVAKERALSRYQKSGRYVSKNFIEFASKNMEPSFEQVKPVVDGYLILDGKNGKIIEKQGVTEFLQ